MSLLPPSSLVPFSLCVLGARSNYAPSPLSLCALLSLELQDSKLTDFRGQTYSALSSLLDIEASANSFERLEMGAIGRVVRW